MGMNLETNVNPAEKTDWNDFKDSSLKAEQGGLNAGELWMALAATPAIGDNKFANPHIPSLPDLDLHHGHDNDVAEKLIDDLQTLVQNKKIDARTQEPAKLLTGKDQGDLPIVELDGLAPGKIGVIMSRNKDGHTYYTPFISKAPDPGAKPGSPLRLNESAARELHIENDMKNGQQPVVDLFSFDLSQDGKGIVMPRDKADLHSIVLEKLNKMAEDVRDKEALERQLEEANWPEAPKPDKDYGYRITERSPQELDKIRDDFAKLARQSMDAAEPAGIAARMKEFGKEAQKDIDFYKGELKKLSVEEDSALKEESRLQEEIKKEPLDSLASKKLQEELKEAGHKVEGAVTAKQLAEYNLSYAQHELKISGNQGMFVRHMQAKASAAAIMSLNPDVEGALKGHRFVINSGHYPEDPKFPGFEHDGTAEWKLNLESQDVGAQMVRMAGGAVKLVNQSDLKDKSMTGLANAIKAAKPEVAVGIHHDSNDPADAAVMKGTLTLQCAKSTGAWSLEFAKAAHMAKINYGGIPDKYNSKGVSVGIREQCGRGVQGRNVGAPFILDEQFSTHPESWAMARDPKINAQTQFARVIAFYEYVTDKPRYKSSPDTAKEYNDLIWSKTDMDDVFKRHPKVGAW